MKFATHIMRIAAVLALTAATTSAFAQNGDYRRGYDEGFEAGRRAAMEERGPGGPPGFLRVRVMEADYGARGARCDARESVRNAIEHNGGAVTADNQLCGDPAKGAHKDLSILYRCGESEPVRVTARENETLRLSCRR